MAACQGVTKLTLGESLSLRLHKQPSKIDIAVGGRRPRVVLSEAEGSAPI